MTPHAIVHYREESSVVDPEIFVSDPVYNSTRKQGNVSYLSILYWARLLKHFQISLETCMYVS